MNIRPCTISLLFVIAPANRSARKLFLFGAGVFHSVIAGQAAETRVEDGGGLFSRGVRLNRPRPHRIDIAVERTAENAVKKPRKVVLRIAEMRAYAVQRYRVAVVFVDIFDNFQHQVVMRGGEARRLVILHNQPENHVRIRVKQKFVHSLAAVGEFAHQRAYSRVDRRVAEEKISVTVQNLVVLFVIFFGNNQHHGLRRSVAAEMHVPARHESDLPLFRAETLRADVKIQRTGQNVRNLDALMKVRSDGTLRNRAILAVYGMIDVARGFVIGFNVSHRTIFAKNRTK